VSEELSVQKVKQVPPDRKAQVGRMDYQVQLEVLDLLVLPDPQVLDQPEPRVQPAQLVLRGLLVQLVRVEAQASRHLIYKARAVAHGLFRARPLQNQPVQLSDH
jgi:hypothetical protein